MALTATLDASIRATLTGSNDLASVTAETTSATRNSIRLENGTGNNQASKMFSDTRTLAASATEDLDLAGSLVDPIGATLTFTAIKAIYIKAADANTNDVIVGGAASNGFQGPFGNVNDTIAVRPGGILELVAPKTGWTVTAGTGDLLKIANGGGSTSVTYDIVIIGI
jgi:hypothetical protein